MPLPLFVRREFAGGIGRLVDLADGAKVVGGDAAPEGDFRLPDAF